MELGIGQSCPILNFGKTCGLFPLFSGEFVKDQAGRKDTVCQYFHVMLSSRPGGAMPGLHEREKVISCLFRTMAVYAAWKASEQGPGWRPAGSLEAQPGQRW